MVGHDLVEQAKAAEKPEDIEVARVFDFCAGAANRIARFPRNRSEPGQKARALEKEAYLKGAEYLPLPVCEVAIPHKFASIAADKSSDSNIGAFLRIPESTTPDKRWPLVLLNSNLAPFTPMIHLVRLESSTAITTAGKPLDSKYFGTANSPAARNNPRSPDRLFSRLYAWIDEKRSE